MGQNTGGVGVGNSYGANTAGKGELPPAVTQLLNAAQTILKQAGPVRKELLSQTLEALKTGGVGARIPIIQRAVEATKAATGQALAGTSSNLAGGGITGPYAATILAGQRQAGATTAANIPTQIASSLITGAPSLVENLQSQGLRSLGAGAGMELGLGEFNASQTRQFYADLKSAVQSLGSYGVDMGGGGGGGGASPSTVNVPQY